MVIDKQRVGQENSVGPIRSSWLDRNVTKGKQIVCIAISVRPITHLGLTETLQRETERLQSHLGETEIPIGETEKRLGFLAVAMSTELGGSRWKDSVGPSWTFWFRTYVDMRN